MVFKTDSSKRKEGLGNLVHLNVESINVTNYMDKSLLVIPIETLCYNIIWKAYFIQVNILYIRYVTKIIMTVHSE